MLKKAVILFSGGLDSTTCLAIAKNQGFACYALTFNYGQKHQSEVEVAKKIAQHFGVCEHKVITLPIHEFGGSALTDAAINVPDYQGDAAIPATYVPARNTIFLAMAMGWAEVLGADDIFIGASSVDYSGYPDCRPAFYHAFAEVAKLATKAGVEGNCLQIHTPLIQLSKAQTIQVGLKLGVDYSQTVSCYRLDSHHRSCGSCDSCMLRKKGFTAAGVADPTLYYTA